MRVSCNYEFFMSDLLKNEHPVLGLVCLSPRSSTWIEREQGKILLALACLAPHAVCYGHFLCFHAGDLPDVLFIVSLHCYK